MKKPSARTLPAARPKVRCAIYTRKSTTEGLEQAFNSLDAQREAAVAYIASQQHAGWTCLPQRYDDGGSSGGNLDRPALQQLLADIAAGQIDCVVVYKVDRLSRSLLDFARLMETFEAHQVAFVSVTQQFHTATSMGRLVLNVLLSFAQFERELIAERTRDKMAATRRQGRWCGGKPLLGYDLDAQAAKLVVNEPEAARVRAIFDLYREHRSLRPVVRELAQRGWRTKRWRTRAGQERGGELITKTHLRRLLTNVTYLGQVRYRTEVYPGQHAALVDPEVWQQVQTLLQDRHRSRASGDRPVEALLHGLLCCGPCACPMTPTSTTRHRAKRYRYYVCVQAQKGGWDACPAPSVPAGVIEHCVIEQVDGLSRNLSGLGQLLTQAREQTAARQAELEADERHLEQEQADGQAALQVLAGQLGAAGDARTVCSRLADLQERLTGLERQTAAVRAQRQAFGLPEVATEAVAHALAEVAAEWPALPAAEQARRLRQLVERVDYDGTRGQATITFHAAGLVTLAQEGADRTQEKQP